MNSVLDELTSQLSRTAAGELDKRLVWDMVCAHADGTSLEDMAVAEWPDGAKSVVRSAAVGKVAAILGPKHKVRFHSDERNLTVTVV